MDLRRDELEGALREASFTLAGMAVLAIQKVNVAVRDLEKKDLPKQVFEQVGRSGKALFDQLGRLKER